MKPRERILRTLNFQQVDRAPFDLMEGILWPEITGYFHEKYGLSTDDQIIEFVDPDIRWVHLNYHGPRQENLTIEGNPAYSQYIADGPLSQASTVKEVLSYTWNDPSWWEIPDIVAARRRFPDYALALLFWKPYFLNACEVFGMEGALIKMLTAPHVFEAMIRRQHEINMEILVKSLNAVQGLCDICWMGDDVASQQSLLMNPKLWRKLIKPYLAEEVQMARNSGMYVLYHSCGAVRAILPDLIEIGVNGLGVFQTTAVGMDVVSIASEFGGKMVFYGGIDVQQLLSFGTEIDVEETVQANIKAFAPYGGYIVSNCHRGDTIKGKNMEAMCRAAVQSKFS
jgi:uroporphyrinogen decarboxylase